MPSYERAPLKLEIPKAEVRRDDFDMITQNGHDAPMHVMRTDNRVLMAPSRQAHRSSMPHPPPPTPVASPGFMHSVHQPMPQNIGSVMPSSTINPRAQFSGAHTPGPPTERPPSRSNFSRLPPRMQALRREQAKNAERPMDDAIRHSSQPILESWEQAGAKESIPIHTLTLPVENSPRMSFVFVERDLAAHSHFIVDSSTPAPPDVVLPRIDANATQGHVLNRIPDAAPQPPRSAREHDGRSVQHSYTDNSTLSAGSGGSASQARRPHHVPKHLVMPAPLQKSHPQATVAPRHRSNPPPPRYDAPPRHQPPPPSTILSPQVPTHALPHRAQDIPVFVPHNNKLRKRGGAPPPQRPVVFTPALPPVPSFPSNRPLSFEPVLDYRNILAPEIHLGKLDKPSKKVLSKRRD
jgi:hypothetical protein